MTALQMLGLLCCHSKSPVNKPCFWQAYSLVRVTQTSPPYEVIKVQKETYQLMVSDDLEIFQEV
jgi:hypothetical protein